MGKKYHEERRRKKAEATEVRDMHKWMCPDVPGEWCPHSAIPLDKRRGSVCLNCPHHDKIEQEMDEEELLDGVDATEQESFPCYCDGELCDRCPVGSCFVVKDDPKTHLPTDELVSVCPRFDVDKLPDGSWIKVEFLKLRKPEGGFR